MAFANVVNQVDDLLIVSSEYHPPLDFADSIKGKTFKQLHVSGKPKNLQQLAAQTHLVLLQMRRTGLTDFSLLQRMRKLASQSYITGSLRECDVTFAAKTLRELWLTGHRKLGDVYSIGKCRELTWLMLCDLPQLEVHFDLKSLTGLEKLHLQNLRHWPSIAGLARAKALHRLVLDKTQVDDGDWEPLLKLKELKFVSGLEDAFGKEAAAEFRRLRPTIEAPRRRPW